VEWSGHFFQRLAFSVSGDFFSVWLFQRLAVRTQVEWNVHTYVGTYASGVEPKMHTVRVLVWLLSGDRGRHILPPKVNLSRTFCGLGKQSPFPVHSKTNITIMTFGSNYHLDLTGMSQAAGAIVFAEQLAAAKSALEHAVTQQNLTHAIAEQAQDFAEEAVQNWVQVHEVLADVR
jgi:hypothetical protein